MSDEKFNAEQMRRIDQLISTNFENATSDDIKLYARWESDRAVKSEAFKARIETEEKEAAERIAIAKEQADYSKAQLDLLVSKALEHYERTV